MTIVAGKNAIDLGIVVKDINASLAFYCEVLGLKKVQEMPLWIGTMHRLAFGDSFIKLIDPKETPPATTKGLASSLGFRYLTLQIKNIDDICEKCAELGISFEIKKTELLPGVTIAMVNDPDGNTVEFVQRD
jgi:catechol 2,3-dioxygenase-like lactoylglutathione lyase family enzyme